MHKLISDLYFPTFRNRVQVGKKLEMNWKNMEKVGKCRKRVGTFLAANSLSDV